MSTVSLSRSASVITTTQYDLLTSQTASTRHYPAVEVFYVLQGTLHVETPDEEFVVESDQALFVDPGSPQRAFNPDSADTPVRVLAIGAPSVDDAHEHNASTDA